MIQTSIRNDRGEVEQLDHNDSRYWEGPYRYEPYPKTLFKAGAGETYLHPEQKIVKTEQERERLGSGWAESPDEARALADSHSDAMDKAAAERYASDRKLSAKAQAEAITIDRSTSEMLPEIKGTMRSALDAIKGK